MVKALADRLAEVSILSEYFIYTSNFLSYSCSWQLKLYYLSYAIYWALLCILICLTFKCFQMFWIILLEKSVKSELFQIPLYRYVELKTNALRFALNWVSYSELFFLSPESSK